MATLRLDDIIFGPLFLPATQERIVNGSILRTSGIAAPDPVLQQFADAPGSTVQIPFWNDITGTSNVSTDDPAQSGTPDELTMGQVIGQKIRRTKGIQAANLVGSLLASDPLDVAAGLIADFWQREEQRLLILSLTGIFGAASMAGNVLAAHVETTAGALSMTATVVANARALLGDNGTSLTAIAMHSRVFWNLVAANAITFGENPMGASPTDLAGIVAWYQGLRVIVSDSCPSRAGTTSGTVYTSYLFAQNSFGYAEARGAGGPKRPVALQQDEHLGNGEGVDTVWYRRHWVMSPRGISFTGTIAAAGAADAALSTGTNWVRQTAAKNVGIVAVTTNG